MLVISKARGFRWKYAAAVQTCFASNMQKVISAARKSIRRQAGLVLLLILAKRRKHMEALEMKNLDNAVDN